ncbi:Nuclear transport regulator [Phytophthora cinnamomi]|uniref:Nuclear transport regulator n=1 Tax=Phytophthora cinnamomi TaxID=4785 RepID=UPI00355A99F2|nr:Nuclear transport regulator [Phytophthora cinnamomi]
MEVAVVSEAVVSEALHQLYSPLSSPRVRRRADSLLQQFQRSPEAAQTALAVLQAPVVDTGNAEHNALLRAKRAFAASTIYFTVASYIRKYKMDDPVSWTPEDRAQHEVLVKDFGQMAQDVWNVLTGPNGTQEELNVQTHLALTIAVILLRFHEPQGDSTVVGAVEWLVQNQQHPVSDTVTAALTNFAVLLTLKVIPEEVDNKRVKFSKMKRTQCEDMVQHCAAHVVRTVLPSIATVIDASEEQVQLRGLLLQAFASWVEHGTVSPAVIIECGLLDRAFRESLVPASSVFALQLVREVVRACRHDEHVQLMELVMHNFVMLGKHLQERMAASAKSMDFCLADCARAISECGQAFIVYFVDYTLDMRPGSLVYEFLDTILFFTSLNNLDISNETMEFWIIFRTYISGKHEQRMFEFETFISRLLVILIERTQYPDGFEAFPEAAKERFFLYRSEVRNVFRALATVTIASEDKFIIDAIHAIFQQYEAADSGAPIPPDWWRRTEVYSQNPEVGAATLDFLLELGSLYGQILRTPEALLHGPEFAGKLLLHQQIQTLFFEKDVQYHVLFALFNAAAGGMSPNLMEKIAEVVRSCWVYFGRQRSEELIHRLLSDSNFLGSQRNLTGSANGEAMPS